MRQTGPPVFKAWLVFLILSTVLCMVAGGLAGAVIGFSLAMAEYGDATKGQVACSIAGLVAGLPVSYLVFQRVIDRMIVPNVWPRQTRSHPPSVPASGGV